MTLLRTATRPDDVIATTASPDEPAPPPVEHQAAAEQQPDLAEKVSQSLRSVRDRAVWVGIVLFLAMEAVDELSRKRRHFHWSVDEWEIVTVNRAKREMRGEGVAALAHWMSRAR